MHAFIEKTDVFLSDPKAAIFAAMRCFARHFSLCDSETRGEHQYLTSAFDTETQVKANFKTSLHHDDAT